MSSGVPLPATEGSVSQQESAEDSWLEEFGDYGSYLSSAWQVLPPALQNYLKDTVSRGEELASDVYEDIKAGAY